MEPPSCWPTLSVAEATPASLGATPKVPVFMAGGSDRPTPAPGFVKVGVQCVSDGAGLR